MAKNTEIENLQAQLLARSPVSMDSAERGERSHAAPTEPSRQAALLRGLYNFTQRQIVFPTRVFFSLCHSGFVSLGQRSVTAQCAACVAWIICANSKVSSAGLVGSTGGIQAVWYKSHLRSWDSVECRCCVRRNNRFAYKFQWEVNATGAGCQHVFVGGVWCCLTMCLSLLLLFPSHCAPLTLL